MKTRRAGFTLIELLVVISIIGLLSSIFLASLNNARAKTKDSQKVSELVQLRNALEVFRSANDRYPITFYSFHSLNVPNAIRGNCPIPNAYFTGYNSNNELIASSYYATPSDWIEGLAPQFYQKLPGQNPPAVYELGSSGANCYVYMSNGSDYKLSYLTSLEKLCPVANMATFPCANPPVENYARTATVYTSGAQNWYFYLEN